jgi:hypothetical protein
MSVIGKSEVWRKALVDVYDFVYRTILRVWPECRILLKAHPPQAQRKRRPTKGKRRRPIEDPITRSLIVLLRRDDVARQRYIINSQLELLPSSPDAAADPIGYLDIAIEFFVGADQLCLAMECKRLNIPHATLAGRYVEEGMMRFVSGQYSPHLPLGGMIGYVMNGDVERAYAAIRGQIDAHAEQLLCDPGGIVDSEWPVRFRSRHRRTAVPIELRHLLLPMN